MAKAKFLGALRNKYDPYRVELMYEYRGRTYFVTDYRNGCSETLAEQHREEQANIDRILAEGEEHGEYTGEVEEALEMLFNYWESGDAESEGNHEV